MRLSSLFRTKGGDKTYGLVAKSYGQHVDKPVYANRDLSAGTLLGHLTEGDVLSSDETINSLFSVFRLDPKFSAQLRRIPHSKHLINNAFGPRPMRLRQAPKTEPGKGNSANQQHQIFGPKGQLIGDVRRAQLRIGNSFVTLDRAGLAKSFGKRAFARTGDSGAPILSDNKRHALVGFVVGQFEDDEVLFVPAEDLADRHNIEFMAPDAPGLPPTNEPTEVKTYRSGHRTFWIGGRRNQTATVPR
jgi:hypothetical protein